MRNSIKEMVASTSSWQVVSSRYLVSDRWFTLRADRCMSETGIVIDPYYVVESKDSVHLVIVNEDDEVLLTCQYRHGADLVSVEFPCGEIEEGESPVEAARRELLEETGYNLTKLTPVGSFFSNPARQTGRVFNFVGRVADVGGVQQLDESESIRYGFFSLEKLQECIEKGLFSQGLHIASWYLAKEVLATQNLELRG